MTTELKPFRVISRKSYVSDIVIQAKDQEEAEEQIAGMGDEEMSWEYDDFEISDCYENKETA